eukprot:227167-Prymnesium_polylepis.1
MVSESHVKPLCPERAALSQQRPLGGAVVPLLQDGEAVHAAPRVVKAIDAGDLVKAARAEAHAGVTLLNRALPEAP